MGLWAQNEVSHHEKVVHRQTRTKNMFFFLFLLIHGMNNNMKDETYFWKYVSNNRRMNNINRCYNWINRSTHDIDFSTNKLLHFACVGMCTILYSQKLY